MSAVEAALILRRHAASEAGKGADFLPWREYRDEELVDRPDPVDRREVALDELTWLSVQIRDACALDLDDLALEPCVWVMLLHVDRGVPRVPGAELISVESNESGFYAECADPVSSTCGAHAIPASCASLIWDGSASEAG